MAISTPQPIIIYCLLCIALLLSACSNGLEAPDENLCPAARADSPTWVRLRITAIEFMPESEVDIGNLTDFRFLAVASNGQDPDKETACAIAVVYPVNENLNVSATLRRGEKITGIGEFEIMIDESALKDNLYLYFAGVNTNRSGQAGNEVTGFSGRLIAKGIAEAIKSPATGDLAEDVTRYLLEEFPEYLQPEEIVGYGAIVIRSYNWRTSSYHWALSTNEGMRIEYEFHPYDVPPTPTPTPPTELANILKNGDFEAEWEIDDEVAPDWYPYSNGQAHFGWYKEAWKEAVLSGKQAQLMEIFEVEDGVLDRVIAISQTVEVIPNATYDLTIHAVMRSDAPREQRNQGVYEMHWGVDYRGEGRYDNVKNWVQMPLLEQLRIGSNGPGLDNERLFYQRISGTVPTTDTNKITLFIRGVKKYPTGIEVNFNLDDVSLFGPSPAFYAYQSQITTTITSTATITPTATATATPTLIPTPDSGQ